VYKALLECFTLKQFSELSGVFGSSFVANDCKALNAPLNFTPTKDI
jgi:hypothetical protein